jgi:hypothetical protein
MKRKEKIHKINKIKGLLSGEYDVECIQSKVAVYAF